ncbi:potassium channel subfamily K member 13-like [Ambystoma mexicanum]|uniref:potassium channel subfamily K member 13-like n=1 Tax=Ambystoma mexicanum TaxID=8296 RepID=UPI0037E858C6
MPLARELLENAVGRSAVPKAVFGSLQGGVMAPSGSQSSACGCGGGSRCTDQPPSDDNARFALLALLMATYLLCGAGVFSALEHPVELENQRRWNRTLSAFSRDFEVSPAELRRFLREYEVAMAAGVRVEPLKPRWDFSGALYFVGTVVSTIGFGMTTPATTMGKIFLIFYGMIGCSSTILFFNLFLERIITLLGVAMRAFRLHQLRSHGVFPRPLPAAVEEERGNLSGWKPSVYNVMLILGLGALVISCCASAMYSPQEGWSYVDSLYFCFVTFSTIGFGDLVSGQLRAYEGQGLYGAGNFLFILLGVCCIYSLFNVISIVIKQVLNWLLRWCCPCRRVQGRHRACRRAGRRHHRVVAPTLAGRPPRSEISMDTEAVYESEADARRTSPDLSGHDFSSAGIPGSDGKVVTSEVGNGHLKVAWKDQTDALPNTGAHEGGDCERQRGLLSDIGSLAVMNNKLAETSSSRCHSGLTSSILVSGRHIETIEHQNRLSSCQSSPASIHIDHCQRTDQTPVTSKDSHGERIDLEVPSSSGVESLANANRSLVTCGDRRGQNGAASSGIGSLFLQACASDSRPKLCKQPSKDQDSDFVEPECSDHRGGRLKCPTRAFIDESGSTVAPHPRSLAFLNRKLVQSNSVDSTQDTATEGRAVALRKNWCNHRRPEGSTGQLLKDVGSLAVMNDRFAETTSKRKMQAKSKASEDLDDT